MKLSHNQLKKTFSALGIPIPGDKLVLFSVRAATPKGRTESWVDSLQLAPNKLDYKHMRCTIGIWNPRLKKIFAVTGSTVPHIDEVIKAAAKKGKGTNQIEPGFFTDFYKGEHLMGKLKGHQALRQTANRFIRRTSGKLPYTLKDMLYFSNPYDNLHCSWNPNPKTAGYSSAGCIVVSGSPHCKRIQNSPQNSGSWKAFHKKIYSAKQKKFSMLLIDISVLKKCLSSKPESGLLCYGSQGEQVKKLQLYLKRKGFYTGPISGVLEVRTYKAWNRIGLQI